MQPIEDVNINPRNTNKHSEAQIDVIAHSLHNHGWRHPIIINQQTNTIVAGEGRYLAAKKLGQKTIPIDTQSFDSELEEYEFLDSDNNTCKGSEYDIEKFKVNLKSFDIDQSRFDRSNFVLLSFDLTDRSLDEDEGEPPLRGDPFCQNVTFILSNDQKDLLDLALDKAEKEEDYKDDLNQNEKGNLLAAILKRYIYG
jgi:hypothetical protein